MSFCGRLCVSRAVYARIKTFMRGYHGLCTFAAIYALLGQVMLGFNKKGGPFYKGAAFLNGGVLLIFVPFF